MRNKFVSLTQLLTASWLKNPQYPKIDSEDFFTYNRECSLSSKHLLCGNLFCPLSPVFRLLKLVGF